MSKPTLQCRYTYPLLYNPLHLDRTAHRPTSQSQIPNSQAMCSRAQVSDGSRNSLPFAQTAPQPHHRVVQNDPYLHPRHLVMSDRDRDRWVFSCGGSEGVNLLDGYERRLERLDRRDDQLFPADFVKVSFLIVVRRIAAEAGDRLSFRAEDGLLLRSADTRNTATSRACSVPVAVLRSPRCGTG